MIAIVTDSCAYLTKREALELGVHYVPILYSIGNVEYEEGFSDQCGDVSEAINSDEALHTSQAPIASFYRVFSGLRRNGHEVICITMSSRLSGMYNNAFTCAKGMSFDGIEVIDSRATAGQLKLLLEEARRLIDEGNSLKDTAAGVRAAIRKVHTSFSVEDMGPLRKSGRLGPVKLSVSTILNIKPILTIKNGTITAKGTAQGTRERINKLLKDVPEDAEKLIVMSVGENNIRSALADALKTKCSCKIEYMKVGPVLGIHLGDGAVGVAWQEK